MKEETTAKQQRQHRKLLSFSQSQTQPGFLRTASFNGITCDILQGDGESREPLWLVPAPLVTVRASKEGTCRGSPESSAQAWARGVEKAS